MENQTQTQAPKFDLKVAEATIVELAKVVATLQEAVVQLSGKVKELEEKGRGPVSETEMTNDMARRMLNGDLKDKSHKDVATELKLSYGQVYSCRLGFTFKTIHKELSQAGFVNPWMNKAK